MELVEGMVLEGKVTGVTNFGAFVALPEGKSGMVHISEISTNFVKDINEFVKVGDVVEVMVTSAPENGKIALSMKRAKELKKQQRANEPRRTERITAPPAEFAPMGRRRSVGNESFEDMMSSFKAASSERFSDLKRSEDGKRSGGYPNPRRKK